MSQESYMLYFLFQVHRAVYLVHDLHFFIFFVKVRVFVS